jgi:hypothetical protein
MITLIVATAVLLMPAASAEAQLPGGLPTKILDGRGNARADARMNSHIQQQIQGQVQSQVQAQANAHLQADINRAADLAQRAASMAQRQANAAQQRIADTAQTELSANASVHGEARGGLGHLSATSKTQSAGHLRLPPGFTTDDVVLYDRIFGDHNPIRAEAPSGRTEEQAMASGLKIRAVNYTETGTDLAARIHLAINQRRAEISQLRDQALNESNAQLMDQADQMELVINTFVEAQMRARAKAAGEASANTNGTGTGSAPEVSASAAADAKIDGAIQAGDGQATLKSEGNGGANGSIGGRRK